MNLKTKVLLLLGASFLSVWSLFAEPQSTASKQKNLERITLEELNDPSYPLPSKIRKEYQNYIKSLIDECGEWSYEAFGSMKIEKQKISEGHYINHFIFPADKEFYITPPKKVTGDDPITAFEISFREYQDLDNNGKTDVYVYNGLSGEPINKDRKLHPGLYYIEFKAYTPRLGSDKVTREVQFASVRGWGTGIITEKPEATLAVPLTTEKEKIIIKEPCEPCKEPVVEKPKPEKPKRLENVLGVDVSYIDEKMNGDSYLSSWIFGINGSLQVTDLLYLSGLFNYYNGRFNNTTGTLDKKVFAFDSKLQKEFPLTDSLNFIGALGAEFSWDKSDIMYDVVKAWVEELRIAGVIDAGLTSKYIDVIVSGICGIGRSGDSYQGMDSLAIYGARVNPVIHFEVPKGRVDLGGEYEFLHKAQEVRGVPRSHDEHTFTGYTLFPLTKHLYLGFEFGFQDFKGDANNNCSWKVGSGLKYKF